MKRLTVFGLLKTILYILIGAFIIIGNVFIRDFVHEYINYIVGVPMFIGISLSISHDFKYKTYLNDENYIASHFISLFISVLIILARVIFKDEDNAIVCILWGIVTIMNSSLRLNRCINEAIKKEPFIFETVEALIEIGLSILLIYDPYEHVNLHIFVLGTEYLLEAFMALILNVKKYVSNNNVELNDKID